MANQSNDEPSSDEEASATAAPHLAKPETEEEKQKRLAIDEAKKTYRATLVALQEKMHDAYDKTVLTLSGGAFGVSVIITKDLIGVNHTIHLWLLVFAWAFWILSMVSVLFSYSESAKKMAAMIDLVDGSNVEEKTSKLLNGSIELLNKCSGLFFICGLVTFTAFIALNINQRQPGATAPNAKVLQCNCYKEKPAE